MITTLPGSPADVENAEWADLAPFFESLATVSVPSDGVGEWLAAWSHLESVVDEAASLAMIAYTCDTTDPAKEAANLRWSSEIYPNIIEQHVRLARRLVEFGIDVPGMEIALKEFETDIEIFREANVPLLAEVEELVAGYQKITGGLEVEWEGERKTVPQLQPFLRERDRAVRERAFRLGAEAYLIQRPRLVELFDRMFVLREQIAHNAGFANYMEYAFRSKHRFDYTPEDCARFHEAVLGSVVPAVTRLMEHRSRVLGVDPLRPWDMLVELEVREPLKPFKTAEGLSQPAQRIFDAMDPQLGNWYRDMSESGLLDLESRPGKAPGGYCTKLSWRGRPFIFMNAVGVPDDVNTLIHESGHAFHDFAAHRWPLVWQRSTGHEAAELASMSMELLAAPLLGKPTGYYTAEESRAVELEQLEDVLTSLVHIATVDAFQRWIYTSGKGGDAAARDAAWLEIRSRFEPGVDWSGLEKERVARWYRQLHIFELPFYYIEYGIAQLGALQLWRDSRIDHAATLGRYRDFLSLGGTRPLPELYAAAGARLVFDSGGVRELVDLVEARMTELRSSGSS